jgi:hypothetical protein
MVMQPLHEQEAPKKGKPHRWKKGESGNPSGRKRHVLPDGRSVREYARDMTPEALELLRTAMSDAKQPMPLRVSAATALLRTGHADVVRDVPEREAVTIVVQRYSEPALPVPGVLTSPIAGHVCPQLPANAASCGEVIDMQ